MFEAGCYGYKPEVVRLSSSCLVYHYDLVFHMDLTAFLHLMMNIFGIDCSWSDATLVFPNAAA